MTNTKIDNSVPAPSTRKSGVAAWKSTCWKLGSPRSGLGGEACLLSLFMTPLLDSFMELKRNNKNTKWTYRDFIPDKHHR